MDKIMRLMVVIDGYFFLELYRLGIGLGKKINITELVQYIVELIERECGIKCSITFMDCYIGLNQHPSSIEQQFIAALRNSCVAIHGRQLRRGKEKGNDTEISWDVSEKAALRQIDGIILIAGDLDLITITQKLRVKRMPSFLVSGRSKISTTGYSKELRNSSQLFFDINDLLNNPRTFTPVKKTVVVKTRNQAPVFKAVPAFPKNAASISVKTPEILQSEVKAVISYLIKKKSCEQGRRLAWVFQSEVISELNMRHIILPQSLGQYLANRPEVFRVGFQPYTNRRTVSCF